MSLQIIAYVGNGVYFQSRPYNTEFVDGPQTRSVQLYEHAQVVMPSYESSLNIILLANRPRIFRELLRRTLEKSSASHFIVEVEELHRLSAILKRIQARWLFVTMDRAGNIPSIIHSLLASHPSLLVLAVSGDGSQVELISAPAGGELNRYAFSNFRLDDLLELICSDAQVPLSQTTGS